MTISELITMLKVSEISTYSFSPAKALKGIVQRDLLRNLGKRIFVTKRLYICVIKPKFLSLKTMFHPHTKLYRFRNTFKIFNISLSRN